MAENKHQPNDPALFEPDLTNPENRHEKSDVNYRAVTRFGVALTLLCIVVFALLIGMFRFLQSRVAAVQPKPAAPIAARRLPPEPRLQSTPIPDLKAVRAAEDRILNAYDWIDRDKGIARIPIGRAIDILAQRGLPHRPEPPAATTVSVPTESSLGAGRPEELK